ncbi:MAG TPA: type II secretion system protein M [Pseudomonas xinjiangensis]|uniref:Type II secretion system protein M n=2 Tax=root TaxID=1 RepID=A0A7V1BPJ2_9GAMM|nr:type II secretion system protein M [Halopseudomonas xinjiangensis]HEC48037.1 type II secretion system protein M [Halopseudomonas xinjiangensis]
MRAWWAGLAPRERYVMAAGLATLALVLMWLVIWEPIAERRQALRNEVSALSADLAWMQGVSDQVRRRASQQGQTTPSAAGGSVLTLVEVSATAAGIRSSIERVQPEGEGARLWFAQVSFDALVSWLGELENRHGLQISQLAVDVSSDPGVVSARLLVEPR